MNSPALNSAGWLTGALHIASPNCDARPEGETIRLIVIHNIALPPGAAAQLGCHLWMK